MADDEAAFIPDGDSDLSPSIGAWVENAKAPVLGELGGLPRMRGGPAVDTAASSRLLEEPPNIEARVWRNVGMYLQVYRGHRQYRKG